MAKYELDEHGGHKDIKTANGYQVPVLGCSSCPAAFFDSQSHQDHMVEKHSDKPRPGAWRIDDDNGSQHFVQHFPNLDRHSPHTWSLHEVDENGGIGKNLSVMQTDREGKLLSIETSPEHQRQGHATALWNHATRLASKVNAPAPKHSESRTKSGDAWAKKVGGELPKRTPVSDAQFRGFRWGE